MTLNKDIVPGTKIRVKSLKSKTAGIVDSGPSVPLNAISLWVVKGMTGRDVAALAQVNEILTVIKKPRKINGINLCLVETAQGIQGEVYWTELRGNCEEV